MTKPTTIRGQIAEIINSEVDWAEWGQDDGEGYKLADQILSIVLSEIKKFLLQEEKV